MVAPKPMPAGRVLWQSLTLRVIERPDGVMLYASGPVMLSREQAADLGERLQGKRGRKVGPSEVKA